MLVLAVTPAPPPATCPPSGPSTHRAQGPCPALLLPAKPCSSPSEPPVFKSSPLGQARAPWARFPRLPMPVPHGRVTQQCQCPLGAVVACASSQGTRPSPPHLGPALVLLSPILGACEIWALSSFLLPLQGLVLVQSLPPSFPTHLGRSRLCPGTSRRPCPGCPLSEPPPAPHSPPGALKAVFFSWLSLLCAILLLLSSLAP